MATIKAILLKPLDGHPEGTEREFDHVDFDRLQALGAVREAKVNHSKAAPAPLNKMSPQPLNKNAGAPKAKSERD